jgi:hypothetical protein
MFFKKLSISGSNWDDQPEYEGAPGDMWPKTKFIKFFISMVF